MQRALLQRLLALEIGRGTVAEQGGKLEQLLVRLRTENPEQYRAEAIRRTFAPAP